jgi:hypothetical protein
MRSTRATTRRTTVFLLAASIAVVVASCGNAPRTVAVPAPQQRVANGHDSPQAAVAGYLTGYGSNDPNVICDYVAPSQAESCRSLLGDAPHNSVEQWRIGDSLVRGNEAIVVVLSDRWCIAKICLGNDDPGKGLPRDEKDFERAFDSTSNWLPAVSVVRLHGKWYVALA